MVAWMCGVGAGVAGHGAVACKVADVVDHFGGTDADAGVAQLALVLVTFEDLPAQPRWC